MSVRFPVIALLAVGFSFACDDSPQGVPLSQMGQAKPAMPTQGQPPQAKGAGQGMMFGKVLQTMNSGGYTYVEVQTSDNKIWAAAPQTQVQVGQEVGVPQGMAMRGFNSPSLNKTFDVIYFVSGLQMGGAGSGAPPPPAKPYHPGTEEKQDVDLTGIEKAKGGHTVAELYAQKAALSGKQVAVRGRVVRVLRGIMDTNWVHLKDGTGSPVPGDLTITTDASPEIGSLVVVKGKLTADKDFGMGYNYAVIIEDGKFEPGK